MKLRLKQQEDGNWTVIARKTRPHEGPTRMERDVPQEQLEATIKRLVDAVKDPLPDLPF